jgi:hypothetical protein
MGLLNNKSNQIENWTSFFFLSLIATWETLLATKKKFNYYVQLFIININQFFVHMVLTSFIDPLDIS